MQKKTGNTCIYKYLQQALASRTKSQQVVMASQLTGLNTASRTPLGKKKTVLS